MDRLEDPRGRRQGQIRPPAAWDTKELARRSVIRPITII